MKEETILLIKMLQKRLEEDFGSGCSISINLPANKKEEAE